MLKKRFTTAVFISVLLLSALAGAHFVSVGKAKPYDPIEPSVSILSPQNQTYNTPDISLNFEVNMSVFTEFQVARYVEFLSVSYELDEHRKEMDLGACENETFKVMFESPNVEILHSRLIFSENITGLSDGTHSFRVSATGRSYEIWPQPDDVPPFDRDYSNEVSNTSDTIYFTIDATPPLISNLSVENKIYNYNETNPLIFTVNELTSWIGYSLNGQANITLAGNTTLTELPCGSHTIVIFANDTVGNTGASETITFMVAEESEPFPTTAVAAVAVVSVAVVSAGFIIYFRKRKH